jgi:hypothetical protein
MSTHRKGFVEMVLDAIVVILTVIVLFTLIISAGSCRGRTPMEVEGEAVITDYILETPKISAIKEDTIEKFIDTTIIIEEDGAQEICTTCTTKSDGFYYVEVRNGQVVISSLSPVSSQNKNANVTTIKQETKRSARYEVNKNFTYTIKKGDTFSKIAYMYTINNKTPKEMAEYLIAINPNIQPTRMKIGQIIRFQ